MELGGLAVCQGSHRLPGFAKLQETYGLLDVERDGLNGTGASELYTSVLVLPPNNMCALKYKKSCQHIFQGGLLLILPRSPRWTRHANGKLLIFWQAM